MSSDSAAAACTADPEGPAVISDSGGPDCIMQQKRMITTRAPSTARQIFSVFGLQMRLFSKSKTIYVLVFIALLIPILAYTGIADDLLEAYQMVPSVSYLLILLPLFIAVIPSAVAGRTLSSEFRNRVVYMNYPLPVTRTVYYTGKFLASFALSLGIVLFAFGLAVYTSSVFYTPSYPNDVLGAVLICVAGTFAITATAFGLGPLFKKGSVTTTVTLTMGLPLIITILMLWLPMKYPLVAWEDINNGLMLLPQFAPYHMFNMLDYGFGGPYRIFFLMLTGGATVALDMFCIVALIWGLIFLIIGLRKFTRKEL